MTLLLAKRNVGKLKFVLEELSSQYGSSEDYWLAFHFGGGTLPLNLKCRNHLKTLYRSQNF